MARKEYFVNTEWIIEMSILLLELVTGLVRWFPLTLVQGVSTCFLLIVGLKMFIACVQPTTVSIQLELKNPINGNV